MNPVRVLVADDHPPTLAGIRLALLADGFEVCAEVSDAAAAVAAALRERPDLCLIGARMPGGGLAAARAIVNGCPGTPVVMLTVSSNGDDFLEALMFGAAGYLFKDIDPVQLPVALRCVLAGETVLPRELTARLVDEILSRRVRRGAAAGDERSVALTGREWEVLGLLREGEDTKAIAERLMVSPVTVRRHVSSILGKLGVPDRAAAVRLLED